MLYGDKDYVGETEYIHLLIDTHSAAAKSIIDLGSGTGRHAHLLANCSYRVHGVERSESMLKSAELANDTATVTFSQGDIRSVRVGDTFDVAISLFHVISYMSENRKVLDTFNAALTHLKTGGLFVFDFWCGPAVLSNRPATRITRVSNDSTKVTRLAESDPHINSNLVDVNYELLLQDNTGRVKILKESHTMRYFFLPETRAYLTQSNFELVKAEEWMTGAQLGDNTWGVAIIAKAI